MTIEGSHVENILQSEIILFVYFFESDGERIFSFISGRSSLRGI